MSRTKMILAAMGIAVGIAVSFFLFFQSDTAKIKKCFRALSPQAEKSGEEHEILAAAKARKIQNLFAESAWIYIPAYDIDQTFDRNEISSRVLYTRAQYRDIALKFYDLQIRFPEKDAALVTVKGEFKATTVAGERQAETHALECEMKKTEDGWFLSGVRGLDVVER